MDIGTVLSLGLAEHISRHPENHPVEKLNEGDDAEAQEEAKESSKGSNEVHWSHPDAPLKLWGIQDIYSGTILAIIMGKKSFLPMTVSLPKKILTTAMSSSQAL